MAKKFVYTITTGRSGTNYLADLFKANIEDAKIYLETGKVSPAKAAAMKKAEEAAKK